MGYEIIPVKKEPRPWGKLKDKNDVFKFLKNKSSREKLGILYHCIGKIHSIGYDYPSWVYDEKELIELMLTVSSCIFELYREEIQKEKDFYDKLLEETFDTADQLFKQCSRHVKYMW